MIYSMTGFGRGEASSNGISITAELKSVNSRHLNIYPHIPSEIKEKELDLKELIQKEISRGRLDVTINIDKTETGQPEIAVNSKLAKGYKDLLDELRRTAGVNEPISVRDLLEFDEIFVSREQDEEMLDTIWVLSVEATGKALEQLVDMRRREGKQLEHDLHERVDHIESMSNKIEQLSEGRAEKARAELRGRIQKLINDETLDKDRLETEVAILADKMDITEEVVRLKSHIKYFRENLESDETVGRRLKFLVQEMHREINTMGSKAASAEISQCVAQAKESLEQIREQVENVE